MYHQVNQFPRPSLPLILYHIVPQNPHDTCIQSRPVLSRIRCRSWYLLFQDFHALSSSSLMPPLPSIGHPLLINSKCYWTNAMEVIKISINVLEGSHVILPLYLPLLVLSLDNVRLTSTEFIWIGSGTDLISLSTNTILNQYSWCPFKYWIKYELILL